MSDDVEPTEWKLGDAKNRLSELVDRASSEGPQIITRSGKKVAVVVGYQDFTRTRERENREFVELLLAIPRAADNEPDFERLQLEPRDFEL